MTSQTPQIWFIDSDNITGATSEQIMANRKLPDAIDMVRADTIARPSCQQIGRLARKNVYISDSDLSPMHDPKFGMKLAKAYRLPLHKCSHSFLDAFHQFDIEDYEDKHKRDDGFEILTGGLQPQIDKQQEFNDLFDKLFKKPSAIRKGLPLSVLPDVEKINNRRNRNIDYFKYLQFLHGIFSHSLADGHNWKYSLANVLCVALGKKSIAQINFLDLFPDFDDPEYHELVPILAQFCQFMGVVYVLRRPIHIDELNDDLVITFFKNKHLPQASLINFLQHEHDGSPYAFANLFGLSDKLTRKLYDNDNDLNTDKKNFNEFISQLSFNHDFINYKNRFIADIMYYPDNFNGIHL